MSSDYGTITVRNPGQILRATVPLPASIRWKKEGCPFSVVSSDGVKYPAQWEQVSTDKHGVGVCEILAHVGDNASQTYTVVKGPSRDTRAQAGNWAKGWMDSPPSFAWTLPSGVGVSTVTEWDTNTFRNGSVVITRRFHGTHIVGWATVYEGMDVVEVEMILHNAEPGSSPWFIRSFKIENAPRVAFAWPEPFSLADGTLLADSADGDCWFMVPRGQRHFRFWIHSGTVKAHTQATELSTGRGWGVSSEWNKHSEWLPMCLPLPDLPMYDARMRQECRDQWSNNSAALQNGTTVGVGQKLGQPGGRIGHFVVWGSPYGGVTGGSDRELAHTLGICGALTGEPSAYFALQSELAMTCYRTAIAIVDPITGTPVESEMYTGWSMSATDGHFSNGGKRDGTFGFYANRFPHVPLSSYDTIAYDRLATTYRPHDWQHFVRAWSPAVSLALLRNDPVALWTLRMWSEVWTMSQVTDGNLDGEKSLVAATPHQGCMWGRAQGHGYAMLAATYALTPNTVWRERFKDVLESARFILSEAQMSNGFVRAHPAISKDGPMFFQPDGVTPKYAVTTPDEEVYLMLAHVAIQRALTGGYSSYHVGCLAGGIWQMAWDYGRTGPAPSDKIAVRGVGRTSAVIPVDVCPARNGYDVAEVALVFAWVMYSMVGDREATDAIAKIAGSADFGGALAALTSRTWNKLVIDDNAFLISALQAAT